MGELKGHMTNNVLNILKDNSIFLEAVPAKLTYLFKPLDVQGGPYSYIKYYMENKFCESYSTQSTQAKETGKELTRYG